MTELKNNDKLKIHNTHSKNILIPFYILFIIFFRKNNYLKIEKSNFILHLYTIIIFIGEFDMENCKFGLNDHKPF